MTYIPTDPSILRLAEEEIFSTYGDRVSVFQKKKSLLKFGRRADLDTGGFGTVADLGIGELHETYLTTNGINSVNSTNAGDTSLEISYEYHTISGSDFTFGVGTATLDGTNGQTRVALSDAACRVSRAQITSGGAPAGDIVFHENGALTGGEPDDATEVHMRIPAGRTQSFKAATSVSSVDYLIINEIILSVRRGSGGAKTVDFNLEVSNSSAGVSSPIFRPKINDITIDSDSTRTLVVPISPYVIVPPNSDVRVVGQTGSDNAVVGASFGGFFAIIT